MTTLEMETEKEMLVPILATRDLIEKFRASGRILFISDMYLPSSFLRDILTEKGFFKDGDSIYVSDELQAWKRDGALFKLIREREGISYREWHHYGDNYGSDYRIPKKLGIHAHYLHYDYLPYEERWRNICATQYQYPSILAGISRAIRLSSAAPDWQSSFVCDISGPFMVSWVLRVLGESKRMGIKRLYFCARDVHSEFLIAKSLQCHFPDIDIKYLIISSSALYKSNLIWEYLQNMGFASDTPAAIVDSCTRGKTLYAINELLATHGYNPINGFFISHVGTPVTAWGTSLYSYEAVPYYLDIVANKKIRSISGMGVFFEHLFSLNFHSRVVDYEYHGEIIRPVFAKDAIDQWNFMDDDVREMKKNNDVMLLGMADAIQLTGMEEYAGKIYESVALQTLAEFITYPQKEYLEYLHQFHIWGIPFVEKIYRKRKGSWKRGNRFYNLPISLSSLASNLLSLPELRKKLHNLVSIMK